MVGELTNTSVQPPYVLYVDGETLTAGMGRKLCWFAGSQAPSRHSFGRHRSSALCGTRNARRRDAARLFTSDLDLEIPVHDCVSFWKSTTTPTNPFCLRKTGGGSQSGHQRTPTFAARGPTPDHLTGVPAEKYSLPIRMADI